MKRLLSFAVAAAFVAVPASAQEFTIRAQTHHSAESVVGNVLAEFFDDIETMSQGRIDIEPFWSSAVVKSVETFDAVVNGILDADLSSGGYQVGKDTAFQFISDPMGGYDDAWQLYAWFYEGGGLEAMRELYDDYGMYAVGVHIPSPESLASTRPLPDIAALEGFKFRSPPGMETIIFAKLGASPIVMDFTEIFTALESGVIEGADMANLAVNKSAGLHDIAKHATYPGFHSTPANNFAIRKEMWDAMPEDLQRIVEVAHQKMAFRLTLAGLMAASEAAEDLEAEGVTLHDWSPADRQEFREAAVAAWDEYADTDTARSMVELHKDFQAKIGIATDE